MRMRMGAHGAAAERRRRERPAGAEAGRQAGREKQALARSLRAGGEVLSLTSLMRETTQSKSRL